MNSLGYVDNSPRCDAHTFVFKYDHYHIHTLVMSHVRPSEYHHASNVRCNYCHNLIFDCFTAFYDQGFFHCSRTHTDRAARIDLIVEDLLLKRIKLELSWDDVLNTYFPPQIKCDYDLCWSCYLKTRENIMVINHDSPI